MGAFFTNVQVQVPAGQAARVRQQVLAAIDARARETGYVPCSGGETPDRTILVLAGDGWVAVYDEATESQDVERLDALAKSLSEATAAHALGILVHDSDQLILRLFDKGRLVDRTGMDGESADVAKWGGVVDAPRVRALQAAFAREDVFVEETLAAVAAALGISEERACIGFRYLTEEGAPPLPDDASSLHFRMPARADEDQVATGPVKLEPRVAGLPRTCPVGAKVRLEPCVNNHGGACKGMSIFVHGPAIEAGLIEPQRVSLELGATRVEGLFEKRTLKNGRPGYGIDFPDVTVPAAVGERPTFREGTAPAEWLLTLRRRGVDLARLEERVRASDVRARVVGRAKAVGAAEAYVGFVPHERREAQIHLRQPLVISPRTRKPLRGAFDDPAAYADLESPRVLVALIAWALDRTAAAPLAAKVVQEWSAMWGRESKLACTIQLPIGPAGLKKPSTVTVAVEGLARSKQWKRVREAFATAATVWGHGDLEGVERMMHGRHPVYRESFVWNGSDMRPVAEEVTPTLQVSVQIEARDDAAALLERAQAIVQQAVAGGHCVQAFVARWGRNPDLYATAYESACGIGGGTASALARSWSTRYLRGLSAEGMWLGRELLAHVDPATLEGVARLEPAGEAMRIVPRDGAGLDALEAALAPVLASKQDAEDARRAARGR